MGRQANNSLEATYHLKPLIGGACYADIALANGGVWEYKSLERVIYSHRKKHDGKQIKELRFGIMSPKKFNDIKKAIKNCDLEFWSTFPLFYALKDEFDITTHDINFALQHCSAQPNYSEIYQPYEGLSFIESLMKSMDDNVQIYEQDIIRPLIWEDTPLGKARKEVTLEDIEKLAGIRNVEAFIVLTAFAREARIRDINSTGYLCAVHIRKIFADVITNSPHLFINWPDLVRTYKDLIWRNVFSPTNKKRFNPEFDVLVKEIKEKELIARNNNVKLPPKNKAPPYHYLLSTQ